MEVTIQGSKEAVKGVGKSLGVVAVFGERVGTVGERQQRLMVGNGRHREAIPSPFAVRDLAPRRRTSYCVPPGTLVRQCSETKST